MTDHNRVRRKCNGTAAIEGRGRECEHPSHNCSDLPMCAIPSPIRAGRAPSLVLDFRLRVLVPIRIVHSSFLFGIVIRTSGQALLRYNFAVAHVLNEILC